MLSLKRYSLPFQIAFISKISKIICCNNHIHLSSALIPHGPQTQQLQNKIENKHQKTTKLFVESDNKIILVVGF